MLDEKNNMNDIHKTEDQLADQAFSEEIRRKLAEPGSGKPTLEEFKLMVYKDRERRRKKRNAMVACIVIACLAGFFAFDQLVPEVGADKNPKEEIVTEDGVIIEDGGWGSSTEEDNVWVINDWNYIDDAKTIVPDILIPKYVPKDYCFSTLKIEILPTRAAVCKHTFKNDEDVIVIEIMVQDNYVDSFEISDISRTLVIGEKEIYIQEMENKIATIKIDDGIILYVEGNLSDKEIINVIEGLLD